MHCGRPNRWRELFDRCELIRADAGKKKRVPGDQPIAWPQAEEASRAVREYLAVLDAAHNDEGNSSEDGSSSGGGNRRKPPKRSR